MKFVFRSMATRLTVWFLLAAIIPMIIISTIMRQNVSLYINQRMSHHLLINAEILAKQLSGSNKIDDIQTIMAVTGKDQITFFVIDQAGTYLAHSDEEKTGSSADEDFSLSILSQFMSGENGSFEKTNTIYAYASIPNHDQFIVFSETKENIIRYLTQNRIFSLLQLVIGILAIAFAGNLIIKKLVGNPLKSMSQVFNQVDSGNFSAFIDSRNLKDELKDFAESFNRMMFHLSNKNGNYEQQEKEQTDMQDVLFESVERYQNLFNQVSDAILVEDLNGNILDANPAACIMYGAKKEELLNLNATDLFSIEYHDIAKMIISDKTGSMKTFEALNKRLSGGTFNAELTPLFENINGEKIILVVVHDISNRKKSEQALHESERKLDILLDNLMGMAYRCLNDRNFTMEFVSKGCYELTGYYPSELIGNQRISYGDIIHPDDRKMVWDEVQSGISEIRPFMIVYRIYSAKGIEKWVMEKGQGILTMNEEVTAIEGFIIDITERKLFEEALRESEERYRLLFEKAGEGILLLQLDQNNRFVIVSANQAVACMHGYSIDEMIARPLTDLLSVSLKDFSENARKAIERGEWISGTSIHVNASQSEFPVEFTLGTVSIGRQNYLMIFYRDITEKNFLQQQIMRSEKMANLGSLAAGIAHELNSPLQIITGTSESLLKSLDHHETIDEKRLSNSMEMINRNGWRCADIVHSLLAYAKPDIGRMEYENLNSIIHDTLLLIQHQLSSWSDIAVKCDLGNDLPDIPCDRNKISQAIIYLLTNAQDAMPGGGQIIISTRYNAMKRHVALHISDNGTGIPTNIKERIFDPFFTTKETGKGTGLGLSIVSSIISAHGGDIMIDSNPHTGTTFSIYLPEKRATRDSTIDSNMLVGRYDDEDDFSSE